MALPTLLLANLAILSSLIRFHLKSCGATHQQFQSTCILGGESSACGASRSAPAAGQRSCDMLLVTADNYCTPAVVDDKRLLCYICIVA
jgi:hypothetical protein